MGKNQNNQDMVKIQKYFRISVNWGFTEFGILKKTARVLMRVNLTGSIQCSHF